MLHSGEVHPVDCAPDGNAPHRPIMTTDVAHLDEAHPVDCDLLIAPDCTVWILFVTTNTRHCSCILGRHAQDGNAPHRPIMTTDVRYTS
jgi:hypothetical protein